MSEQTGALAVLRGAIDERVEADRARAFALMLHDETVIQDHLLRIKIANPCIRAGEEEGERVSTDRLLTDVEIAAIDEAMWTQCLHCGDALSAERMGTGCCSRCFCHLNDLDIEEGGHG